MWDIVNRTPFAAERCWVRDKDGAEVWLVAVRATFNFNAEGSLDLAEEQVPVCLAPEFTGDPTQSSLLYDSDLHHKKLRTDVLLHGHAYAPDGKPVEQVDVRLRVADVDKTIRVFGDRVWQDGGMEPMIGATQPFTKMPLTFERAFGGADTTDADPDRHDWLTDNPVGIGFATRARNLIGKSLPNLEDPASLIKSAKHRPQPMAFGPIPGHWTQRVQFSGTYDRRWEKERLPLLPEDFDEQFYQCAPGDQQTAEFLKGGESVELFNLTPGGKLSFQLPKINIGFSTYFGDDTQLNHRGVLHTVIIEPDLNRLGLVWHTHLPCHHKVNKLLKTRVLLKQRVYSAEKLPYGVANWEG